jgi:hypothetical protein
LRTDKNATTEATRSMLECTASVRIATDPVIVPAMILSRISSELEMTDSAALRSFVAGVSADAAGFSGEAISPAPAPRGRDG